MQIRDSWFYAIKLLPNNFKIPSSIYIFIKEKFKTATKKFPQQKKEKVHKFRETKSDTRGNQEMKKTRKSRFISQKIASMRGQKEKLLKFLILTSTFAHK